jgi:hypothetical protein
MHEQAATHPAPTGILLSADAYWKTHKTVDIQKPLSSPFTRIHDSDYPTATRPFVATT